MAELSGLSDSAKIADLTEQVSKAHEYMWSHFDSHWADAIQCLNSVESEEIKSGEEGEASLLQAYAAMKQLSGYADIETAMGAGGNKMTKKYEELQTKIMSIATAVAQQGALAQYESRFPAGWRSALSWQFRLSVGRQIRDLFQLGRALYRQVKQQFKAEIEAQHTCCLEAIGDGAASSQLNRPLRFLHACDPLVQMYTPQSHKGYLLPGALLFLGTWQKVESPDSLVISIEHGRLVCSGSGLTLGEKSILSCVPTKEAHSKEPVLKVTWPDGFISTFNAGTTVAHMAMAPPSQMDERFFGGASRRSWRIQEVPEFWKCFAAVITDDPASAVVADPCDTTSKFSAGRTMIVGEPATAAHGLLAALGVAQGGSHITRIMSDGVAEITREFTEGEHCDEKDKRRFNYIFGQSATLLEQTNGVKRDAGHEGMMLEDFLEHQDALKAKLAKAHVLALRLYTSNSYGRINWPLRGGCTEANPHPYAATTWYIHDGIMKLRATREDDATAVRTFWRGMSGTTVSDGFMKRGGTEMGCMSTTETQTVARTFAKVGEVDHPLLLKVQSTSLMDCGADIGWLSMYPEEREVLFPPLTYLLPVGEPVVEDGCTVITVQPRF
jgi:hypothetical protein